MSGDHQRYLAWRKNVLLRGAHPLPPVGPSKADLHTMLADAAQNTAQLKLDGVLMSAPIARRAVDWRAR